MCGAVMLLPSNSQDTQMGKLENAGENHVGQ